MHNDADCLSRNPVDQPDDTDADVDMCTLSLSGFLNIGDEQRQDPVLQNLMNRLSYAPPDPSLRMFALRDGIFYRRNVHSRGPELLLVVPKHLRLAVLQELHDAPTAGHMGITRTYGRVRRRFFWPGLYRSVRRYVASCDLCQRRQTPALPPADVARYARRCGYVAAVVNCEEICKTSVTVQTPLTETAEEVAIAIAVATTEAEIVISDSQAAIRNCANSRVSPEAL
ncbi:uncharacterized protein LOC119381699 [Rhipicephalus sanguineus]|uniref:uncharacterized protein LOC119381699 n=1 Tax=Rhipicephalus sanguineus TaxID=34632 RepID=UPI00189606CF|nr:uncharacterized protein LOC119381699 [Rhipicephalus sanguineus]